MATTAIEPPAGFKLDTPPPPEGFQLDGGPPHEVDFSQIKTSPYERNPITPGDVSGDTGFAPALIQMASHPLEVAGGALKEAGDVARAAVSDAVTTGTSPWTGFGAGGNLHAMFAGDYPGQNELPVDVQNRELANEGHGGVATLGKIGQGVAGTLPFLAAGGLPSIAQRLLAAGFSAKMISDAPELARQLGEQYALPPEQRDKDKLSTLTADAVQMGLFAPAAGAGAVSGKFLTKGERVAAVTRELSGQLQGEPSTAFRPEPAPQRQLGIPMPPELSPDVLAPANLRELANRTLQERQQLVKPVGQEPALFQLRREFEPQIEPQPSMLKEEPLGGQISFNAPAEAEALPSARQTANPEVSNAVQPESPQPVRPLREQPIQGAGEVPAEINSGEANAGGNQGTEAPPQAIAKDFGLRFEGEQMGRWMFTAFDNTGKESTTFVTKAGVSPEEVATKYESVRGQYGDQPNAPRELKSKPLNPGGSAESLSPELQQKSNAVKSAMQPGELPGKVPTADDLLKLTPRQITEWKITNKYGPDDAAIIAKEIPQEKIPELVAERDKMRSLSQSYFDQMEKDGMSDTIMKRAQQASLKAQTLNEIIEAKNLPEQVQSTQPITSTTKNEPAPVSEPTVESVTALDKASGIPLSATDALINKLESLKLSTEGASFSVPHPEAIKAIGKAVWNTAVDSAIAAIKAGRKIGEAIEEAISYVKKNAKGFDEGRLRANLHHVVGAETTGGVPAGVPGGTVDRPVAAKPINSGLDDVYRIFDPEKKAGTPLKQRAINIIEAARTDLSSKFRPINKLAEDIAKAYGQTSSKDIAGIMEQLKGSQGRGEADIYRFDRSVSDLVKGDEKDFNAYMFLRRSIDRLTQDQRDIQTAMAGGDVKALNRRAVAGYTLDELNPKLATLEAKLGPEKLQKFQQAASNYQTQMDMALREQVESGRMSPEVYDSIKAGNQFYAPFKVMKYLQESGRPSGTGKQIDTPAEFTKAMVGIEDPNFKLGDMLGAARQNLLLSRILADKNMAMRHVAELSAFDTEGRFIRKLKEGQQPQQGYEAVNVFEGGKQNRYEVDPNVAEAIKLYGGNAGGVVIRMLNAFSIPFKAGATALNLPFQISNLLADVPRQAFISKYGVRGFSDMVRYPLDFVHSLFSSLAGDVFGVKNKLFLDFLDSGVAGTTVQQHLTPEALKFKEPTAISKSKQLGRTVLYTLPNFANAIEQTSKVMGVKRAMRFEDVASGKDLKAKIPEAITELRRFSGSPDFGRQGAWVEGAKLNLLLMFLNARIQGAVSDIGRLTGRDGVGQAAKTWLKVGSTVAIPTAYLWMLNNSPEYKAEYDKRSQQEKQNYWLIPKGTYITNEDGEKMMDYWRIPKRDVAKWVAQMTESALSFFQSHDPKTLAQGGGALLQDISPVNIQGKNAQEMIESIGSSLNPLIKAPLELGTGRDLYRHRDLIPDSMKKASPEEQYTQATPEAFKTLAKAMPDVAPEFLRSPIILDNLTRNLTAGLLTQFLPKKPVQGRSGIENQPLLQRFQAMPFADQQKFKEQMDALEREAADEQLTRHRAATKLLDDNKGKSLETIVGNMPKDDEKLVRHVVDLYVAKQNGATQQDRQLLALPARQRAAYIANQIKDMNPTQKEQAILDFARKRVFTEAVAAEMPDFVK